MGKARFDGIEALVISHVENDRGLDTDSPSLLLAQIEVEVYAILAGEVVMVFTRIVITTPTEAHCEFSFEQTGLAFVAAEDIREVQTTH